MNCSLLTFKILITLMFVTALGELLEQFVLHLTENPSECYFPSVEYTGIFLNTVMFARCPACK